MRKKLVFKIIGIVTACVLAFFGAVVGIMALMGKFRVPDLYPETLNFSSNEITLTAGQEYANEELQLYSFEIVATNANTEHEVNQRNLTLWFEGFGFDLIELCDAEGNPLSTISETDNRYIVQCNAPIYYRLKEYNPTNFDPTSENNGKVVLKARTERADVSTEIPLTLWIDRKVENVYIDLPSSTNNEKSTQSIILGLDESEKGKKYISYNSVPNYALQPIGREKNPKNVELYFDSYTAENVDNDFALVTPASIEKYSDLKEIVGYDEKGIYLKSTKLGTYEFKLAVFDTYANYYAPDPEEMNYDRLKKMQVTNVEVSVVNADIDEIFIDNYDAVFDLFGEENYLVVNTPSADSKVTNLGLRMQQKGQDVTIREGEATIKNNFNDLFTDIPVDFASAMGEPLDLSVISAINIKSSVRLGGNKGAGIRLIDSIEYEMTSYKCTNGAAAWFDLNENDELDDAEIKKLKVGTYVDFYLYLSDDNFVKVNDAELKYTYKEENREGWSQAWNIEIENEISNHIKIGVLVVNHNGTFEVSKLFKTNGLINVEEIALKPETIGASEASQLDVTFAEVVKTEEIEFKKIIDIVEGSYNACVLAMLIDDASFNYANICFELLNYDAGNVYKIKYNGAIYAIVGYFDKDGNFVNALKAKDGLNAKYTDKYRLSLIQFKHNGSAEEVIKIEDGKVLIGGFELSTEKDNEVTCIRDIKNTDVEVSPNYILTNEYFESCLQIDYMAGGEDDNKPEIKEDGVVNIFETLDYKVAITDNTGKLTKVLEFYGYKKANIADLKAMFEVPESVLGNLVIKDVAYEEEILTITYSASNSLADPGEQVNFSLTGLGETITFAPIEILSSAPESLIYVYGDGDYVDLSNNPTITIQIGYDSTEGEQYLIGMTIGEDDRTLIARLTTGSSIFHGRFNKSTSSDFGFKGAGDDKKFSHAISYTVDNPIIEFLTYYESYYPINIVGLGNTTLTISIKDKRFTIPLTVETVGDFELTATGGSVIDGQIGRLSLSEKVTFNYKDDTDHPFTNLADFVNIKDLRVNSFGGGSYIDPYTDKDGNWILEDTNKERILTISKSGVDWVFGVGSRYSNTSLNVTVVMDTLATSNERLELTIGFTNQITADYNSNWKDRTIYQGTKVLLYEKLNGDTTLTTNPLIIIRDKTGLNNIQINGGAISSNQVTFNNCGLQNITITTDGGGLINTLTFTVVPNIVVTENSSKHSCANEYEISALFTVQQYPVDKVYGIDSSTYADAELEESSANVKVYKSKTDPTAVETITPDWIEEIGGTKEQEFYMRDKDGNLLNVRDKDGNIKEYATITFKNDLQVKNKSGGEFNIDQTFKALIENGIDVKVEGFELAKIILSNGDEISANEFKYSTPISEPVKIVELEFKDNSGKKAILNTRGEDYKLFIVPYIPETNTQTAITTQDFDLLSLYGPTIGDSVYMIKVLGIFDKNGEDITSLITSDFSSTDGKIVYVKGSSLNSSIRLLMAEINTINATVKYEFTYINENGVKYEDDRELTIENCQTISTSYAFGDAYNYTTSSLIKLNEDVLPTNISFEPIWLGVEQVVDFNSLDEKLNIKRAEVSNKTGITLNTRITSVELVAYQNIIGLSDYALSKIEYQLNSGKITFKAGVTETYGLLVFKLKSTSNATTYYGIYVSGSIIIDEFKSVETKAPIGSEYENIVKGLSGISDINYKANNVDMFIVNEENLNNDDISYDRNVEMSGADTPEVNCYTKITLAVVYNTSTDIFIAGYVTIYVQPTQDETVGTPVEGGVITAENPDGDQNKAIKSMYGTYNYLVPAGTREIPCPFTNVDKVEIDEEDRKVVNASGTTLNLNHVVETTTFTIKYSNGDNFVLLVNYTYEALELPTNTNYSQVVGSFVENVGFNDTVELVSSAGQINEKLFGKYQGSVTISCGEKSETFELTNGYNTINANLGDIDIVNGKLVFTLTQETHTETISITYNNVIDASGAPITKTFTFTIAPNYLILANDNGANGNALSTTPTGGFNSENGSTIGYTYQNSDKGYYVYTFGGYTIYSERELNLIAKYNKNADGQSYFAGYEEPDNTEHTLTGNTDVINFVHLAGQERNNAVQFNFSFEVQDRYTGVELATKTVVVRVVSTYSKLDAKYIAKGASQENVTSGYENPDVFSFMFGAVAESADYKNNTKVGLYQYNSTLKKHEEITGADFEAMGFKKKMNPNYLTFYSGENHSILTDGTTQKIQFAVASTSSIPTILTFDNKAGLNAVNYKFYIQKAGYALDGINYAGCDGVMSNDSTSIAYLIADTNQISAYDVKLKIGQILDDKNNGILHISAKIGSDYFVEDTVPYVDKDIESIVSYSISYTLDSTAYTIRIAVNKSGEIYLLINRPAVEESATLLQSVTISDLEIFGTTDYIINKININVYNYDIKENFASANKEDSYYAGHTITLTSTTANTTTPFIIPNNDVKFVLDMQNSVYTQNNIQYPVTAKLLEMEGQTLKLYEVGSNVHAVLKFKAQVDDVTIKVVTYRLEIKRNHQFVVNGGNVDIKDNTEEVSTNFVLTNTGKGESLGNNFPLTVSLIDTNDSLKNTPEGQETLYGFLKYKLWIINHPDTGVSSGNVNSQRDVNVEAGDEATKQLIQNNIIEIDNDNKNLIFKQDYTGDINLKLSYKTEVGTYTRTWIIHVTGLIDYQYKHTHGINGIITTDNSKAFSSGDEVTLVGNAVATNDEGYGLTKSYTQNSTFTGNITLADDEDKITYTVTAKYLPNGEDYTNNEQMFNSEDAKEVGDKSDTLSQSENLKITLPFVPVTNSSDTYIVIYEIKIQYLGSGNEKTFYVAYLTQNLITVANKNAKICVDGADQSKYIDGSKLNLFYYADIYTVGKDEYTVYYNGTNKLIQRKDATAVNCTNTTLEQYNAMNPEQQKNCYFVEGDILVYAGDKYTITERETQTTNDGALLDVSFKNIDQFIEYMTDGTISISTYSGETKTYEFKPTHVRNGLFAIDLANPENKPDEYNLFTNELVTAMSMKMKGQDIFTINPYNKESNPNGFMLYSAGTIQAYETKKLSELFTASQLQNTVLSGTTEVIAVGDTDTISSYPTKLNDFVNQGSGTIGSELGFIEIGGTIYTIKEVAYTNDGAGTWYAVGTTFNIIICNAGYIINKDIQDFRLNTEHFLVSYIEGSDTQTFNIANHMVKISFDVVNKKWEIDDSIGATLSGLKTASEAGYSITDGKLTIDSEKLQEYKNTNPEEINHIKVELTATATADGKAVPITVYFVLPEDVAIIGEYGNLTDISLKTNGIKLALAGDADGIDMESALTAGNVTKIVEVNTQYIQSFNLRTGEVVFFTDKINEYFNPEGNQILEIQIEIETTNPTVETDAVRTQVIILRITE